MLRRLGVQTAGESHGLGMLATITGAPAGCRLDLAAIDATLALRQGGTGRSSRQHLERDKVEVLAGALRGRTTGAPLVLAVWNRDRSLEERPPVHRPRPGHADLAGGQKYGLQDMRGVLERASARETAARVAAGAFASGLLAGLGVELLGHTVALGPVAARPAGRARAGPVSLRRRRDRSPFYTLDPRAEAPMAEAVDKARRRGDTLGGVVEVGAWGVPAGLGSLEGFGSRLDARLGAAILSIPAFKAVEVGEGAVSASLPGSVVHDPVGRPHPGGPSRRSNRAGGVEGGMSNGQPLVVRGWMKPLSTLARPLASWDYAAGKASKAHVERSDITAVPAAAIVAEAMIALVVLDALLEKTGGDTLTEVRRALTAHRRDVARRFGARDKPRKQQKRT